MEFNLTNKAGKVLHYKVNKDENTVTVSSDEENKPSGELVIPASVTYEGKTYSVTSIGNWAFYGCKEFTSISIPNSITSIGYYAFFECSKLTIINVATDNPDYKSIDGVLYNKEATTLICCPEEKTGSFVIPTTVTNIGDDAFGRCTGLTSITIPNSVTSIASYAFEGCSKLTSVTIPNSVMAIEPYAFDNCTGLTSIICEAKTPPSCDYDYYGFNTCYLADPTTITIYVPAGSVQAYKEHETWGQFKNIQAIGTK